MIVGVVGLVLAALLGLTSGWTGVLVFVGLYGFATGVWTLARGRSWVGRVGRPVGAALIAGSLIVTGVGAAASPVTESPPAAEPSEAGPRVPAPTPTRTTSPTPTPSPTPTVPAPDPAPTVDTDATLAQAQPQTALATVALLEVKGRAPKTGYDRDLFGSGWIDVDRNGCDTRNDILGRDLEPQTLKPGTRDCVVLTGVLNDPYSATTIEFTRGQDTSNDVQIDHVVALSDSWQKGAQSWDEATRVAFANDPMNLLAVGGPLNAQKGDGDAATWLPPNKAYRCAYVARQVGVKFTYGLWVTAAERDAMVGILSSCPNEPLPAGSATPPPTEPEPATPPPEPAPVAPSVPEPPPPPAAPPSNCDPSYPGVCIPPGPPDLDCGDIAFRRFAVVGSDPHGFDGNGDGIGCES